MNIQLGRCCGARSDAISSTNSLGSHEESGLVFGHGMIPTLLPRRGNRIHFQTSHLSQSLNCRAPAAFAGVRSSITGWGICIFSVSSEASLPISLSPFFSLSLSPLLCRLRVIIALAVRLCPYHHCARFAPGFLWHLINTKHKEEKGKTLELSSQMRSCFLK